MEQIDYRLVVFLYLCCMKQQKSYCIVKMQADCVIMICWSVRAKIQPRLKIGEFKMQARPAGIGWLVRFVFSIKSSEENFIAMKLFSYETQTF